MKNLIYILLVLFVIGCNEEGKNSKIKRAPKEVNANTNNNPAVIKNPQVEADKIKELMETPPVTKKALKSWLPEKIGPFKRTSFTVSQQQISNLSSIKAKFINQDNTEQQVDIEVMDGAGPIAPMLIAGVQMRLNTNFEEQTQTGYSKTFQKNGIKAFEKVNTLTKNCELQYMEADRFFISLRGKKISAKKLWNFAGKLKTDELINL